MRTRQQKFIHIALILVLLCVFGIGLIVVMWGKTDAAYTARTIAQLRQYINAIELTYTDTREYPGTEEFACLGDYNDDRCWDRFGTGVKEDEALNAALLVYLRPLPAGPLIEDVLYGTSTREGYIYRTRREGQGYEIRYLLEGKDQDCGFGEELQNAVRGTTPLEGETTLCTIIR